MAIYNNGANEPNWHIIALRRADEISTLKQQLEQSHADLDRALARVANLESALRVARGDLNHAIKNEACEFSCDPIADIDKVLRADQQENTHD